MAEAVYILCGVTSLVCAGLLIRAYLRTRMRLLLWSCLCFVGLAINNSLLFVDVVVIPDVDIGMFRTAIGLVGLCGLIYGLVLDAV